MTNPETIRDAVEKQSKGEDPEKEKDKSNGEEDSFLLSPGLKPPSGVSVAKYRFSTDVTGAGRDIHIVMWGMSYKEERQAMQRGRGQDIGTAYDLMRACVREIDGEIVDWRTGKADGLLDRLMNDLGPKGRTLLMTAYTRQCVPTVEEQDDFFAEVKVGTAG